MTNLPQGSLAFHQHDASYLDSPPIVNEASTPPRRYNCSVCSTSFRRREHFERHLQSHSKSKDFKCDVCDKQFTRRDTLQRHSAIHGKIAKKVQKPLARAPRACINCVKSKQRCSGSIPCDRCNNKNWLCQFSQGSREVGPQEQEILPETTGQRMINANNRRLLVNDFCQPFPASAISPTSLDFSNTRGPGSVAFPDGAYSYSAVPNQSEQTAQYQDVPSLFDSYLLWPLDDAFNDTSMSADQYRLQTTPGPTGTMAQPPAISHRGGTVTGLRNVSQEIPRQSTEDSRPLSSSQSDNGVQRNELTEEDRDILISEDYAHVSRPSKETYESVYALYAEVRRFSPETSLPSLPSLDILHACTQLFFEHFHPSFPILHQATFRARTSSWSLYLVVAALGSQYSRLSTRAKIFSDLIKIIRVSLLQKLNNALTMQNDLELAQATLLFHFALLFGGNREGMMHLQYQRNVLVTMFRPLLVPGILFAKCWIASNATVVSEDWSRWVATESWKRIIYFTWLMECCQLILLDLPTIIAVSDLHVSMPCHDELWRCESCHEWERLRALQRDPQECPGVLSLLKMDVIDHECISRLSDPALWISVVSIYVADRQASQQQSLQLFTSTHNISKRRNMDSRGNIQAPGREEDTVDAILGRCQQITTERRHDSPMCLIVTKFSLILRLLRFIKYRLLYLSSGWMAQNEEVRAARQHIAEILRENPRQARHGLLHAAQLFRVIRSQHQFDPFDSFFLLIVILYIWNYTKYVISHSPLYGGGEAIFRIDQNTDADLQAKWLAGTFEKRKQVHIGGIGILDGHSSMSRIFKEAMRILDHDKAWSRQADAIKSSLHQVMRGVAPSFADEEIATTETVT